MEVALEVRVSTHRPHQPQTIEPQRTRLRAWGAGPSDWQLAEAHVCRDAGDRGAQRTRPGVDPFRDRVAAGAVARVLVPAPDRRARHSGHQRLLRDAWTPHGCQGECLERPRRHAPHDPLLLQMRGAGAAYARTLLADRMRRGRQAKLRSGQR
jgi:site-specific DNA recombinase